jgi:hypothetical protein
MVGGEQQRIRPATERMYSDVAPELLQSSVMKSASSMNPTCELRHRWSWTSAMVETRRLASSSALLTSWDWALRAWTRSKPTTDVRLFLTRWLISRVSSPWYLSAS